MIFAATASFSLAVVLGLTLVVLGMRYRRGSLALAVAHVVAALVGLALLLRHIADSATQRLYNLSAFLFVLVLLANTHTCTDYGQVETKAVEEAKSRGADAGCRRCGE